MANRPRLITVGEAARILAVAPNTVRAWGATGALTEYRHPVNNYRLFRAADVTKLKKTIDQPQRKKR